MESKEQDAGNNKDHKHERCEYECGRSEEFGRALFDMSLEAEELISRANEAKVGRERCECLNVEHGRVFDSTRDSCNGQ